MAPRLVIFQSKRVDASVEPADNIPFHLEFYSGGLALALTTPGSNGSNRTTLTLVPLTVNKEHHITLAFDTKMNDAEGPVSQNNRLAFWLDGGKEWDRYEYSLWSTATQTYPKFGLYRGEDDGLYNNGNSKQYVFNSYMYGVQISDTGLHEIANTPRISL
ncbi:MAG: hypothetical protein M1820_009181 [Bogoriella megaspora]|nr:MAG: hypothetical protein M1820_009181 [Bogoriella megaspora]